MRILYGVQATGNGHIARARVLARAFSERGLRVDFLLSGRARKDLFGVERFGAFDLRRGLTFDVKDGRVRYLHTALKLPLVRAFRDIASLELEDYDLVISDFEPITAWAARLGNVPSLGISHQCAFHYDIPTDGENFVARSVMRNFAPVKHCLGLHWDSFGFPIIPPLIDLEITPHEETPVERDKVLVYLPFEGVEDILRFTRPHADTRFVVYMGADPSLSRDNIVFRRYSKETFQADLLSCSGVVCNAGFELPSECIHLGKRLLVKPVYGQMEQLSNAKALTELGLGHRLDRLEPDVLSDWLSTAEPSPRPFGDVAGGVVDWLVAGDFDDTRALSDRLWANVSPCPRVN